MTLQVELTREDYFDFNVYHFIKHQLLSQIIYAFIGFFGLFFLILRNETSINLAALAVSMAGYFSLYALYIYYWIYKTKDIPVEGGHILGLKEFDFTENVITINDNNSTVHYKWTSIIKAVETNKAFYLYIDANAAILVPKRLFTNTSDLEKFKHSAPSFNGTV